MRIDVVSIFPDYLAPLRLSLPGKAQDAGLLEVVVHDLRQWTHDRHHTVDDTPSPWKQRAAPNPAMPDPRITIFGVPAVIDHLRFPDATWQGKNCAMLALENYRTPYSHSMVAGGLELTS